jgi:hypothetical protein
MIKRTKHVNSTNSNDSSAIVHGGNDNEYDNILLEYTQNCADDVVIELIEMNELKSHHYNQVLMLEETIRLINAPKTKFQTKEDINLIRERLEILVEGAQAYDSGLEVNKWDKLNLKWIENNNTFHNYHLGKCLNYR